MRTNDVNKNNDRVLVRQINGELTGRLAAVKPNGIHLSTEAIRRNYEIIGDIQVMNDWHLMPNGYKARTATCNGKTYDVYQDYSVTERVA